LTSKFHELPGVEEVPSLEGLELPRARTLGEAIVRQKDFSLVKLLRHSDSKCKFEYLIVDVECDGVPPKNAYGINYRERLALCVPEGEKQLVEVWALRKEFPLLPHQNHVLQGWPASLCLYFEPTASVLRTWTPQKFLRRIQWWLEASARGQLHAADQPVEQLFFSTKYELVLPWNFSELKKDSEQKFHVFGRERTNGGITFFLQTKIDNVRTKKLAAAPVELTLSSISHGTVEVYPSTLGELSDILETRGANFIGTFRDLIQSRVSEDGAAAETDEDFLIILLHVPLCREAGMIPERVVHHAFLVTLGTFKLGVDLGVLFLLGNRYYKVSLLGEQQETKWRAHDIFPMEVLQCNGRESARTQSGLTDPGPKGVIVGAGSLGSTLLNLWGRAGWGEWTVIDNDHIKPHNLSRHTAFGTHIGVTKIDAMEALHSAMTSGASTVVGLFGDACDISEEKVWQALREAELVVDASTTLEYPRIASTQEAVSRHLSVFITPNGNSAVLLAENADRSIRLRTLEAQYYRALISSDWGQGHLESNGTFWSGASCRDISTVLPYSRIVGHAGTLAEQIQQTVLHPRAVIRIWARNPDIGEVIVHDIPVAQEWRLTFDDLMLYIDENLGEKLRSMRLESLPNETGGVLLGYYDFNVKTVVIVDALPAPADSESSTTSFERGVAGLSAAIKNASERTAGLVAYLGEWHSHPRGYSSNPSREDELQLVHLALQMADDGLPAISLIVGEDDIKVVRGVVVE
jgi:integrative and conjugative element protein (TIGR02256 family)